MGRRRIGWVFSVWSLVFLILINISMPAFDIQLAKAETTITVPDPYPTIQAAINAANPGDTVSVKAGTYPENVIINKTLSVIGENKHTTIVDGGSATAVTVTAKNVVFQNFTTKVSEGLSFPIGIVLNETTGTLIADNNVIGGGISTSGIRIYSSTSITLTRNNITGSGSGVVLSNSSKVSIAENKIAASSVGIGLVESFNNTIASNNLTEIVGSAILLSESFNNTVADNKITGWIHPVYGYSGVGIQLRAYSEENGSSYNTFCDNEIRSCDSAFIALYYKGGGRHSNNIFMRNYMANNNLGMQLYHCSNFTFRDNIFSENTYNIGVYGFDLLDYVHDMDSSNTVNGKPIYYFVNRQNLVINPATFPNIGYLALVNSTHITAEDLVLTKNSQGLLIASTTNSQIINNQMANNMAGIFMDLLSSNITISDNNITNQSSTGILSQSSFNNTLIYNTLSNNGVGVRLKSSFNTTLTLNTIANNSHGGVWLDYSFNNSLTSNNIIDNSAEEISDAGISLYQSYTNKIFHNNLVNNERQAYTCPGNAWDDGYPSGGNYWSDYVGVDEMNGPNQDQLGSDGIGDTPYAVDSGNRDRYPFMKPLGDITPPVTVIDLSGLQGDNQWYRSDVTVTLSAADNVQVDKTEYSFDDAAWTTYTAPLTITYEGTTTVYYKSTDKAGNSETTKTRTIKIDKTQPTANAGIDQTVNEDIIVAFDGSASTDKNGVASHVWTFNDVTPQTLTGENPTYTFTTPGKYTITLNVTDPAGNSATDAVVITVLDITNPVANAGQDQTVNIGATVAFDAGGSTDNVGIVSYEWDFGDGTTDIGMTTTHTYAAIGTYTVTLTVKDAAGNTASDSLTITVQSEGAPPPSTEAFPIWIAGAAVAIIAIAAVLALLLKKRK